MVADYLPLLLRGAALSLCVMLASLLVALLLGLVNSLIKLFGPPWLRHRFGPSLRASAGVARRAHRVGSWAWSC